MIRERIEGNGQFFLVGLICWFAGIFMLISVIVAFIKSAGLPPNDILWIAIFPLFIGTLTTFGGLVLLLQAGLGHFYNMYLLQTTEEKSKSEILQSVGLES